MTPTESDLARSLEADLRLCQAATPGPWIFDPTHPHLATRGVQVWVAPPHPLAPGEQHAVAQANVDGFRVPAARANADFIAAARDGWPAAIRRALTAEAQRDALRAEVYALLAALAGAGPGPAAAPLPHAGTPGRPGGCLSDPDAAAGP